MRPRVPVPVVSRQCAAPSHSVLLCPFSCEGTLRALSRFARRFTRAGLSLAQGPRQRSGPPTFLHSQSWRAWIPSLRFRHAADRRSLHKAGTSPDYPFSHTKAAVLVRVSVHLGWRLAPLIDQVWDEHSRACNRRTSKSCFQHDGSRALGHDGPDLRGHDGPFSNYLSSSKLPLMVSTSQ